MSFDAELDERFRAAAFAFLRSVQLRTGGLVRREDLRFEFEGRAFPLRNPQAGIYKPKMLEAALSISTAYASSPERRPYDDSPGPEGYLRYKWQEGAGPDHYTTRSLRAALREQRPLIWFQGIAPGLYEAILPVWLVAEEPAQHQFVVAVDEIQRDRWISGDIVDLATRRRETEATVRRRLHQPVFRARVLHEYESQCAICRLRYRQLLDAAHIKPDSEGGKPIVPNGISLCKLHHSAYDSNLLGIDPEYRVQIRADVLDDSDGPTLRHSLQEVHESELTLPQRRAARPNRDLLAERFEVFRQAS